MAKKLFVFGLLSCVIAPALAHHSAPAFFRMRDFVSVEGVITGARLANPHSYYRVTTDDGTNWAWESASSWTALAKLGWTADTLPDGTRVRMSGMPAIVDKPIARFSTVVVFGAEEDDDVLIILVTRSTDWGRRAVELGEDCGIGIDDCLRLSAADIAALQSEFGDIGIWSPLAQQSD